MAQLSVRSFSHPYQRLPHRWTLLVGLGVFTTSFRHGQGRPLTSQCYDERHASREANGCRWEGALALDDVESSVDGLVVEATELLQTEASRRKSIQISPHANVGEGESQLSDGKDSTQEPTESSSTMRKKRSEASTSSKVGINLSVKWMKQPLRADQAVASISTIREYLQLARPIERVKTYDLSLSNRGIVQELLSNASGVTEIVVGIGNKELKTVDMTWLRNVADRFGGDMHVAVGNEPDRSGIPASLILNVVRALKEQMPMVKVTIPFAYSIMKTSHPVPESELEPEFFEEYKEILLNLDYITINIYPFLSAGVKGVSLDELNGPDMSFLSEQIEALKVALGKVLPNNQLPIAIGETGWPSCGAARSAPYNFATLDNSYRYLQNVARWFEANASDNKVLSGFLFTAFDEETKGTRAIEHAYGILTSNGTAKGPESCVSNATEPSVAWLEKDYPDCESDLDWMVKNFDNPKLEEKFAGRDMDGSLCSFQQYLYDRWASCPPVTRIAGDEVHFEGGQTGYGVTHATTKCTSPRLADKYADRGAMTAPLHSHLHPGPPSLQASAFRNGFGVGNAGSQPEDNETFKNELPELVQQGGGHKQVVKLPVYWINLEKSSGRRSAMERMFDELRKVVSKSAGVKLQVTRVSALSPADVRSMERNGSLTVEATLIDACTYACPVHHARGELLRTEMGCSLSHLRAIDRAYQNGDAYALILEDDVHIYDEFVTDFSSLLHAAPSNWTALQLSTVSSKALLTLSSSDTPFRPRQQNFYGTGSYLISRLGMSILRQRYATHHFTRLSPDAQGVGSLQAESILFGSLPQETVQASTNFYFNFMDFPTTVHKMSNSSEYYAITSLRWQSNFLHQHRGAKPGLLKATNVLEKDVEVVPETFKRSTFLAMTTLVCRSNSAFATETQSIAKSINALRNYKFNWTIYVIVGNESDLGHCDGVGNFSEFTEAQVSILYRASPGRFSKWVYYTEDTDIFAKFDFLMVFDADMGLYSFPWNDYFNRYETYAARSGPAPITGTVRNRSPFHPLRRDWWQNCSRNDIRFVETDFVEQWFAMLSGPFAAWYLKKVIGVGLVIDQRSLGVDWGVDASWCGAAAEWSNRQVGCLLIPIDMFHGDTRSLKQDKVFHQRGEHLTNLWWERVPQWMLTSQIWLGSLFQDPAMVCSPCGIEERYHIPVDLRGQVPIVPTGVVAGSGHYLEGGGSSLTDPGATGGDAASGSVYARIDGADGTLRSDARGQTFCASGLLLLLASFVTNFAG